MESEVESGRRRAVLVGALLAVASAVGTLFFAKLANPSGHPLLDALKRFVTVFLVPGLVGAMAIGGNVHAFSFWAAAPINAAIYFAVGWFGYRLFVRSKA